MQVTFPEQAFLHNGGPVSNVVYGYFLNDPISGFLMYSERFTDGPYSMDNAADQIRLQLRFTGETEFGVVPVP